MLYEFTLCEGRHETPAKNFIFGEIRDVKNTNELMEIAKKAIPEDCTTLVVYVTGLTVAMLAVVNVCLDRHIGLIAKHYDRETGTYYRQCVINPTVACYLRDFGRVLSIAENYFESAE